MYLKQQVKALLGGLKWKRGHSPAFLWLCSQQCQSWGQKKSRQAGPCVLSSEREHSGWYHALLPSKHMYFTLDCPWLKTEAITLSGRTAVKIHQYCWAEPTPYLLQQCDWNWLTYLLPFWLFDFNLQVTAWPAFKGGMENKLTLNTQYNNKKPQQ